MRLAGKVALVTGIESETGQAIASVFAREGAHVVGCCRPGDEGAVEGVDGIARLVVGDAANRDDAARMVEEIVSALGHLDVVVNYGAARRVVGTIFDVTDADFDEEMRADLKSVIALSSAAITAMARNDGGGSIVNISSIAGSGVKARALRSASKAALSALTRAMALDHAEQDVRVNAVLIGPTLTEDMKRRPDFLKVLENEAPLKRLHTPEDVATAVLFLASDEARQITGALLPLDAGRSLPTY